MELATRTKFSIARWIYRPMMVLRKTVGKDATAVVKRGGFRWDLDLNQAIDFSIYLTGTFQGNSIHALCEAVKPGNVVFDIGANVGSHTLHLAQAVGPNGRVYAFEPTRFAYQKLRKNVALNPALAPRVVAEQMMVVSRPDAGLLAREIYSSFPIDSSQEVHEYHRGVLMDTDGGFASSIDSYCQRAGIPHVDVVKIDVDGHECDVIRGARATLEASRPLIVIELSPCLYGQPGGDRFEDLIDLLREARYRLFHEVKQTPLPMDSSLRGLVPEGGAINAIARPV